MTLSSLRAFLADMLDYRCPYCMGYHLHPEVVEIVRKNLSQPLSSLNNPKMCADLNTFTHSEMLEIRQYLPKQ